MTNCIFALLMVSIIAFVLSVIGCMMNDRSDAILVKNDDDNDETPRRERYQYAHLEECSDPELWMEIHHHESGDEESSAAESHSLVRRPSTLLCYMSLSNTFGKLHEIMTRDYQQRGRGHAVLHQFFLVLRQFEETGITEEAVRALHQMVFIYEFDAWKLRSMQEA